MRSAGPNSKGLVPAVMLNNSPAIPEFSEVKSMHGRRGIRIAGSDFHSYITFSEFSSLVYVAISAAEFLNMMLFEHYAIGSGPFRDVDGTRKIKRIDPGPTLQNLLFFARGESSDIALNCFFGCLRPGETASKNYAGR
tara:strand:- start:96 stop:509 length:414 start_codon:yes stop_codon:yes gene_type:complete